MSFVVNIKLMLVKSVVSPYFKKWLKKFYCMELGAQIITVCGIVPIITPLTVINPTIPLTVNNKYWDNPTHGYLVPKYLRVCIMVTRRLINMLKYIDKNT